MENKKHFLKTRNIKHIPSNMPISKIGIGTYLGGNADNYTASIIKAVKLGCNFIDTAINYRGMLSEIEVGKAVHSIIENGIAARDELVIATKGGFVPCDWTKNQSTNIVELQKLDYIKNNIVPSSYLSHHVIKNLLGHYHSINCRYIEYTLERSLKNMDGIEYIDIYYLHNPEKAFDYLDEATFYYEMFKTFEKLEYYVSIGKIKYYGIATYNAFRFKRNNKYHIDLSRLMNIAQTAGGENHHFKYLQLPYNKAMQQTGNLINQHYQNIEFSTIDAAIYYGLKVITNVSLNQGNSTDEYSIEEMIDFLIKDRRIASSLIGMKTTNRVEDNISHIKEENDGI